MCAHRTCLDGFRRYKVRDEEKSGRLFFLHFSCCLMPGTLLHLHLVLELLPVENLCKYSGKKAEEKEQVVVLVIEEVLV